MFPPYHFHSSVFIYSSTYLYIFYVIPQKYQILIQCSSSLMRYELFGVELIFVLYLILFPNVLKYLVCEFQCQNT